MSIRRLALYFSLALLFLALSGIPIRSASPADIQVEDELIAGRNVNMVSGTKLPLGDPWLQRQNEPSGAISWRNPQHLFVAANDYRTVDMPDPYEVRGIPGVAASRDAWIGVFISLTGGGSFYSTLLPGFPQDASTEGLASPIHGFDTACDPRVCAGAGGLLYLSGIAFNRSQNAGAVFVTRYVDHNNRERVDEVIDDITGQRKYVGPIEYWDTNIVLAGNPGQFIDMPNMAVDIPRGGLPYGNVYLACTVFLGNTDINVRSKVVFLRSIDGGKTWSKEIKLTESQHIIQRPVIAIDPSDPTGKTIYVILRRFAQGNAPGGIVFFKSIDGGLSFSKPADVATLLYPFDQWTKGDGTTTSFRTNSYPSLAVNEYGVPWVVWAERYDQNGMPSPDGQSRIVFSYSDNGGITWTSPQFVDPNYTGPADPTLRGGHQFMPSITCAGGIKTVIWYDQCNDIALHDPDNPHDPYSKFVEDISPNHRHTIDVRAAEAPSGSPLFGESIQVSRYLYFMTLDEYGEPIMGTDGFVELWQGELDYSGLPLFWLGTKPFHGDYIEVIPSPQVLPPPATPANSWVYNTSSDEPTIAHGFWSDTRDVWPPNGSLWGDWITYNPPDSVQDPAFEQQNPCNNLNTTGMRNQNVYTATLNHGVIVGSPGNTKQLDIQRSFVVFVKDTLGVIDTTDPDSYQNRSFNLTLHEIGSANASFDQLVDVNSIDIAVPPHSSVSCTVYVDACSMDLFAPVRVEVRENSLLVGRVYLNPDSMNNPILDPSGGLLGDEHHTPRVSNPKIWKYDVGNNKEPNASFLSPRAQNPRAQNSGYVNPRAQNPRAQNPRAQNPRAQNPRAQNENIVNHELYNPRAQNASVINTSLTDMTWTVTNDGNTTSAYTFNLRSTMADYFNGDNPPLIAQVLVYKVHTVPIDNECALSQTHVDELMVNVTNPRAQNPRAQNITPTSGRLTMGAMSADGEDFNDQDITFYLAPYEEAEVTLRVYDPDINDQIAFETTMVAGETVAEAANTGETEPVWTEQPNIPWENPLPAIVASPISLSFSGSGSHGLDLSLTGLAPGESLEYTLSVDLPDGQNWLSILPTGGTLDDIPLAHTVTVDDSLLSSGSYVGSVWVQVPGASNNPLRIPVYLTVGAIDVPEIRITYTYADDIGTPLEDGATFGFGVGYLGSSSEDAIFEIENIGDLDLTLGGKPIITIYGPDADQFRVIQQPTSPVAPDYSTTFILQFAPTSVGSKTAMISIMNNDLDENPFDIVLQGTCEVTTAQLVAYYPFNGNANDESGNGYDGQVSGATLTEDRFGNVNSAYYLDGLNDVITTQQEHFANNNMLSVSLWVKALDTSGGTGYFVMCSDFGVWQEYGEVGLAISLPGTNSASGPINYDEWYHFVGTYDGSYIRAYVNGVFVQETLWAGNISDLGRVLEFGFFDTGTYQLYWEGYLDDIRIYNYALSVTDIQQLYAQESPLQITGLVAHYPFNGDANDASGNGNDGTVYGGAAYGQDRFGNPNGALVFDGVDNYVGLPNESNFDLTTWSITAVIKVPDYTRINPVISKGQEYGNYTIDITPTSGLPYITFQVLGGNETHWIASEAVSVDQFVHIAATYNYSTKEFKGYLNGVLKRTLTTMSTPLLNDGNATIGLSTFISAPGRYFIGAIDDIRIYNRVLSGLEIAILAAH